MPGLVVPAERSIIVASSLRPERFCELVNKIEVVTGLGGYEIGLKIAIGKTLVKAVDAIRNIRSGAVVIYNYQKAGINIVNNDINFAKKMAEADVDAAILFPFTDPQVEENIKELHDEGVEVIIGTEMTQPRKRHNEGDYTHQDALRRMFDQAVELGVRDFVVPGNRPDKVAESKAYLDEAVGEDWYSLFSTGFITQDGTITEAGQAAGYSWHNIIGQGITKVEDLYAAVIEYAQQILGP